MAVLGSFVKQPAERQDYDIDFTDYLDGLNDQPSTVQTFVDPGINLLAASLIGNVVKVWLDGGTAGTVYKVTINLSTVGGRLKQVEIRIKVKEF